jgi:hypothetical protein
MRRGHAVRPGQVQDASQPYAARPNEARRHGAGAPPHGLGGTAELGIWHPHPASVYGDPAMVTRRYASAGTRWSRRRNHYQAHGHGYLGERTEHVTCDSAQPVHGMAGQRERNGKPCDDARGQQPAI